MRLLLPLVLANATTEGLNMVPTKDFFKPVLVVIAPLDRDNAKLLGCDYLYDANGVPHHFEGTHRPEGELSGAHLRLMAGDSEFDIKTEFVGRFGVFKEAKELQLRLRAHLPQLTDRGLVELFQFLASVNKGGYEVTVTDQQGSLVGAMSGDAKNPAAPSFAEAGPEGVFSFDDCTKRPFSARNLKASVYTVQFGDELFAGGWQLDCQFREKAMDGKSPHVDEPHSTAEKALEKASYDLFFSVQQKVQATTPAEVKSRDALVSFLVDLVPSLKAGA